MRRRPERCRILIPPVKACSHAPNFQTHTRERSIRRPRTLRRFQVRKTGLVVRSGRSHGAAAEKDTADFGCVRLSYPHGPLFGFDRLLRICLGRHTSLRLYGPPGFAAQVGHKLAAYTWNLVENYPGDFVVEVWEVDSGWQASGTRLRCHCLLYTSDAADE